MWQPNRPLSIAGDHDIAARLIRALAAALGDKMILPMKSLKKYVEIFFCDHLIDDLYMVVDSREVGVHKMYPSQIDELT